MGALGIVGNVIVFPFKLIFGGKKKEPAPEETPLTNYPTYTPPINQPPAYPVDASTENLKAKVDLMLTQIDSLKIEYEAINQRIQNIERMVRELYAMAKS
ncbi:MAG: hypothetical protein AABW61_02205 [Candidatus Aenigmatarchaeota archaeon]